MRRLVIPSVVVLASFLSGCGLIGKGDGGEDDPDGRRGVDEDGDGYLSSEGDCDDNDADVNPDAAEPCDGVDNNCDGQIDENGQTEWYRDADADGFGDEADSQVACEPPQGYTAYADDCDDRDDAVYPGAEEICDGVDNDCNGRVDDGAEGTWYEDADGDGYGDPRTGTDSCESPGRDWVDNDGDCDDDEPLAWERATELCDGVDNDCNGDIDDDPADGQEYPADADGDGFGDPVDTVTACEPVVDNASDCDDSRASEPQVVDEASSASSPDGSLGAPWLSVQDGIDAANLCVAVYPGTYVENIDFGGNDVEVFSMGGAEVTTLRAPADGGTVVTFQSGESVGAELRGFTVSGGGGTLEETASSSACGSSSTCTTYYQRSYGGGILVDGASPTLRGLWVVGNSLPEYSYTEVDDETDVYVYSYGGGIFVNDSTGLVMENVNIAYNFADAGGGLYVGADADFGIDQSRVLYNSAAGGGGIAVGGGTLDLTNVILVGNTVSGDGGGLWMEDADSTWWNVTAVANSATTGGGVAAMGTSSFHFYSSIVAFGGAGAGIYGEDGATVDAAYSDAYDNTGGEYSNVTDPTGRNGNVEVDPDFTSWTDNATDDDDFTLGAGSALIDAGNPSATYDDADGTPNDVGAYGGPEGSGW